MDDLRAFLLGEWTVRRAINDDADAFRGTARFADDGAGGLLWAERGTLHLGAHHGEARRRLRVAPDGAGAWLVRFDDDRPFHRLDLRPGHCAAEHVCGADIYRGTFAVLGPDALEVVWRIRGPRKDDVIRSRYARGPATSDTAGVIRPTS